MRKLILLIAVAALIGLAGCSGADTTASAQEDSTIHKKWADSQAGVVCYIYEHSGYAGGSIECLPMDDTENDSSTNLGDTPTETRENGIVRTVYPGETNVCYTYEHSGYAGGDTSCLDFNETKLTT